MMAGITPLSRRVLRLEKRPSCKRRRKSLRRMLLKDLLKSGPKMSGLDGAEDGSSMEGYDDFSTEAVATAMAAQGGIGISRMLLKQLKIPDPGSDIKVFSSSADHIIAGE